MKFKWPLKPKPEKPDSPIPASDIDIETAIGQAVNTLLGEAGSQGPPKVHKSNVNIIVQQSIKELIKNGLIPPDESVITEAVKLWQR